MRSFKIIIHIREFDETSIEDIQYDIKETLGQAFDITFIEVEEAEKDFDDDIIK